jgi:hypothetical protein
MANTLVLSSGSMVFAAGFLIGTAYVAARIRYPDLLWGVILPPIVFAGALGVVVLLVNHTSGGDLVTGRLIDLSTTLAGKAPLLLAAEGLAVLITLIRIYAYRRARHWKRSPHERAGQPG